MEQLLDGNHALELLLAGNRRWAGGNSRPVSSDEAFAGPLAALVCCSELGPVPEQLFGRPGGSLFVMQGAGICLGPAVVSGLAYAIHMLDVRLIMIMAHTGCRLGGLGGHRSGCAAHVATELQEQSAFAELVADHHVDLVPLLFDHESARVGLLC